jgi:hypothetical protein
MLSGCVEHIAQYLFAETEHGGETGNALLDCVSVHEAIDARFAAGAAAANRFRMMER